MKTIENTRQLAHSQARRFLRSGYEQQTTLIETLKSLDWHLYVNGSYDQRTLSQLNIELDPRGCHGRIAIAFAAAEILFPDEVKSVKFGEVVEDFFWDMLMEQWNYKYRFVVSSGGSLPEGWLSELLMYEEPHGILTVGEMQYDPLFTVPGVPAEAKHAKIHALDPWSAVHCATLVAHANLAEDLGRRLAILEEAVAACPTMLLPIQNAVEIYFRLGMMDEARQCLNAVMKRRKTAGAFIMWQMLNGSDHPDRRIVYDKFLWPLVTEHYADTLAGQLEDGVCA